MRNTTRQRFGGAALALTLLGGLSACGDDDDETTTEGTTGDSSTDGTDGTDASGGDADLAAACSTEAQLNPAVQGLPFPEGDEPTPEDVTAAQEHYTSEIEPLLVQLADESPDEVDDLVAGVTGPLEEFGETGDFSLIEDTGPGTAYDAFTQLAAFFFDGCDDPKVEVSGVNYAFEGGVPTTTGLSRIHFTNDGTEMHEMVVFRRADDTDLSFTEIFDLGEEGSDGLIEFQAAAFAPPGEEAFAEVDLTAGDYAMVCFVPTGTVSEADFETNAESPPHFTQGMLREFTVEG